MDVKFQNQIPFYEIWYGKLNLASNKAFWFRYTLLNGKAQEHALWAIYFEPPKIIAQKSIYQLKECEWGPNIRFPSGVLTDSKTEGRLPRIQWQLSYNNRNGCFDHVPSLLKWLHVTKSLVQTPVLDADFTGIISVDGVDHVVSQVPGMIGHVWGKRQALSWAWGHCNQFEEHSDVIFEGLSAQISIFKKPSPRLTMLFLKYDGKEYIFNRTIDLFTAQSSFGYGFWTFHVKNKDITLSGKMTSTPKKVAVIPYTDTDNSMLYCYNSKLAKLELDVQENLSQKHRRFTARDTAAFEWVTRETPQGELIL